MITFITAFLMLLIGYFVYGKIIERVFGVDPSRPTPVQTLSDGVDYVPLSKGRSFLIQFLNIAGLGPIFGPIMGALFGPAAFLWIVLGGIIAGGVHDYFAGMVSIRNQGKSVTEISGLYLGRQVKAVMVLFSLVLLLLVGTVFVMGPAGLISHLKVGSFEGFPPDSILSNTRFWVVIILCYYILSTILPIDKIIGKLYPIFGFVLLFMAVGIAVMLLANYSSQIPELTSINEFVHPHGLPLWPVLFMTIACGALSGFHSTQSPLISRCVTNEGQGRFVFYGAMLAESAIAMVWAAAAMTIFPKGVGEGTLEGILYGGGGPGVVVNSVSQTLLGTFGGVLAVVGVIICPITSGDTSFRSARLIIADLIKLDQRNIVKRLYISVPIFIVGFMLTNIDFGIIWRYFTFANQALASVALWTAASYLVHNGKGHWLCSLPATFITATCINYIIGAGEGLNLGYGFVSNTVGLVVGIVTFIMFILFAHKRAKEGIVGAV